MTGNRLIADEKMRFFIVAFCLLGTLAVILSLHTVSAYQRSFVAYTNNPTYQSQFGSANFPLFNENMCKPGQDFVLQIDPAGCVPSTVRSDLLEDQNVPIFCPIVATQINPLIDINSIDNIQLLPNNLPQEVAGIGYQPARAALGSFSKDLNVNNPVFNDLGYAVIVLKQQQNESNLSNCEDAKLFGFSAGEVCWVEGNITARLRYDLKNAFGVGKATFYLPETSDDEWSTNAFRYGFWEGKGFLRADSITADSAQISIYSGRETVSGNSDKVKLSTITLKKGDSATGLTIPGFNFCYGTMDVKLTDLVNPDTRARIQVNGDTTELTDGERFIDNKCVITDIVKQGFFERVKGSCDVDDGSGKFNLEISPKVRLSVNGVEGEYASGDFLYSILDDAGQKTDKSVYVGYIGSDQSGKLFVVPVVSTVQNSEDFKNSFIYRTLPTALDAIRFKTGNSAADTLKTLTAAQYGGLISFGEWLHSGSSPAGILSEDGSFQAWITPAGISNNFEEDANSVESRLQVLGFASPKDVELSTEVQSSYDNAIKDYHDVFQGFSREENPETGKNMGQEALENEINLSISLNQKRTALGLCRTFEENYPSAGEPSACSDLAELSSDSISVADLVINGKVYRISLDGIFEPSLDEYSVEVSVAGARDGKRNGTQIVGLNGRIELSNSEFISLSNLESDYAEFNIGSVEQTTLSSSTSTGLPKKIKEGEYASIGKNGYVITVNKINLKKLAKVTVNPKVNNANSNATFNFKVGIEKRSIQLSPEKTKEKIDSLNKTIEKWTGINENIGKIVQTEKAACFVTQGVLTAKNFLSNLGGEGIARQRVMRSENGWFDRCDTLVRQGQYSSVDVCLSKNSAEIDSAVQAYKTQMSRQDDALSALENGIKTSGGILGEDVVNTTALLQRFVTNNYRTELESSLQGQFANNEIKIGTDYVDVSEIVGSINYDNVVLSQAKELQLNARILASSNVSETTKEIAREQIKSDLGSFYVNIESSNNAQEVADNLGVASGDVNFVPVKGSTELPYKGLTYADISNKVHLSGIASSAPVAIVLTSDGKTFYAVLSKNGNDYPVTQLYDSSGQESDEKLNLYFKYYDSGSYENPYENYAASFYETGEYKGLPAIVPFDIEHGWYAAVKSTLPVGGSVQAYDKSGRVSSFWLCNVGENGKEEFFSGIGDDKCQQMNLANGQTYSSFAGLDASKASQLVSCAVDAIESASNQRERIGAGLSKIKIDTSCAKGFTADVKAPATSVPDIQCQDFMSPTDCNILFNVCDPVICPSSRCDFGGTFPVSDVVQSGVVGSLALCAPNFGNPLEGGVAIPVCLSGLNAGIDSYLSVLDSYQQCLSTSLQTGQTVGVCDEIYSIYTCDFFWRQAVPLVDYLAPKVTGKVLGQDVRGGGEYLSAKDAFDKAGQSLDYFTQYYAENSFQAFKLRSTEDIGTALCGNWMSVSAPNGGSLFDSLTTPDSPPQFYGRFDEIPYSTTTNPPTSQYKVFYHIYAGKDFPANYQVYLRGSGSSFYQDTSYRRIVAQGFVPAGQYVDDTPDFLAPSGYDQLCIVVNGQEECGFKQVTTDAGLNYLTDKAVASQASQTDIISESKCVSGSVNGYSLLNPNLQSGVESAIDPAIYNQGITRVCATDNPGKGTDAKAGTQDSRWVDVGYCGDQKVRCWLDTNSVSDTIKSTSIENQTLSKVETSYVDQILSQGGYLSQGEFSKLSSDIKSEQEPEGKIKIINDNIEKVFLNQQVAYLTFLRGNAYMEIAKRIFDKIVTTGETTASTSAQSSNATQAPASTAPDENVVSNPVRCEDCGKGLFNRCTEAECVYVAEQTGLKCNFTQGRLAGACTFAGEENASSSSGNVSVPGNATSPTTSLSCSNLAECRQVLGNEVGKMALDFKQEKGISDTQVQQDTGFKSFECLALGLAYQESHIQQCGSQIGVGYQKDSNPLYCDGNSSLVLGGDATSGGSFGVMQINADAHPDAFPEAYTFSENVDYSLNHLFAGYQTGDRVYNCYRPAALVDSVVRPGDFESVTYSGWKAAIRNYNGWNGKPCYDTNETTGVLSENGNPRYVDEVLGSAKTFVEANFPGECA